MNRTLVLEYANEMYGTVPEYLWPKTPDCAVLRHTNNRKWYAIIMNVSKNKLGLNSDEKIDIINVKCDPLMVGSLQKIEGIFPAYHMNKEKWISVALDGSAEYNLVRSLLNDSYYLTNK